MEVRAPEGQYRLIGLDPVDTLTWPSGPLQKDCETFDEALDLAANNDELYLRIYIYNDNGEILHEDEVANVTFHLRAVSLVSKGGGSG